MSVFVCFSIGVYLFGLFTTDIFVNAGQVVTGNLAPHFLTVCKPNFTALGCQQAFRYISHQEACTGNEDDILRARKTFPSKEAALSVYAAVYMAVSISVNQTNLLEDCACGKISDIYRLCRNLTVIYCKYVQ